MYCLDEKATGKPARDSPWRRTYVENKSASRLIETKGKNRGGGLDERNKKKRTLLVKQPEIEKFKCYLRNA